ncbi:hypothetical protein LTR86_004466 [Recurvomyces mirabilis]|nr:hypothetical protein LTR86_004466 [Recurvomyces mirabilis]
MTPPTTKTPPPSTLNQYPPPEALDTIIELKVGQHSNIKSFFVHKGLITFYSSFFRAAFCGKFAEAASGAVSLPNEDAATVEAFIIWIYFRTPPMCTAENPKFIPIWELWTLADAWQTPMMANALIDCMRDRVVKIWALPEHRLDVVYNKTLEHAGLRRFVTMVIVAAVPNEDLKKLQEELEWSSDVKLGIFQELLSHGTNRKLIGQEDLAVLDLCQYHQHEEGVRCSE